MKRAQKTKANPFVTSDSTLSVVGCQLDGIRAQVKRKGRVTRDIAQNILVTFDHVSTEKALARLEEYRADAETAFKEGARKKIAALLDDLDYTFAVADTVFRVGYRCQAIDKEAKWHWQTLTESLINRTLPALEEIPYGDYQRALKEVQAFCADQQERQRAGFEIRPADLLQVASELSDSEPYERSKGKLFTSVHPEKPYLPGPPYDRIPLESFAWRKKPSKAKSAVANQSQQVDYGVGLLGPAVIENLRVKIWQFFSPSTALDIVKTGRINEWQAAKLRFVRCQAIAAKSDVSAGPG